RRRGRQQEAVRPTGLGQGGGGVDGRPRRRGLREPALRRDVGEGLMDNLLSIPETKLPEDPAAARIDAGEDPTTVAADLPSSSLPWAVLAERSLDGGRSIEGYAYARTGYHRGLDALRRSGW